MPSQTLHLASRVERDTIVNRPEHVLQQMSIKIWQRRQEVIDELIGKRVVYETGSQTRTAILERVDGNSAFLRDSMSSFRIALNRLRL